MFQIENFLNNSKDLLDLLLMIKKIYFLMYNNK